MFRALKASEVECRINQIKEIKTSNGETRVCAICLLYKDARCDQKILDETFGPMGWQRKHAEHNGNLFCSVGVYDNEKKEWVWKEDAGSESNVDAQKGHASDSFKRACFNWGIGRELYTPLFIFFDLNPNEYYTDGKNKVRAKSTLRFSVQSIETVDGVIRHIEIVDKKGNVRWAK